MRVEVGPVGVVVSLQGRLQTGEQPPNIVHGIVSVRRGVYALRFLEGWPQRSVPSYFPVDVGGQG